MKRNISKMFFAATLAASLAITGCGTTSTNQNKPENYIDNLDEGVFYVRDINNKCAPVYFGAATFEEGNVATSPSNDRVLWYTDDMFENIPTLYAGDSLIYKTPSEFEETFTFERFEDFGYSIGLCHLTQTESGRYSISTKASDNNTFPDGDTDELLLIHDVERVRIDTLGDVKLRAPKELEDGTYTEDQLTRVGSIKNLEKDKIYNAEIYTGTFRSVYQFKANVRIFGSMEVTSTTDYVYESEKLIRIGIPSFLKSGYYLINGVGSFKYVNDVKENEPFINYNEPRENEEENEKKTEIDTITVGTNYNQANKPQNSTENNTYDAPDNSENETHTKAESVFSINEPGLVEVEAYISDSSKAALASGKVIAPSGATFLMDNRGETLNAAFETTETGSFTVQIFDLDGAKAKINVSIQN